MILTSLYRNPLAYVCEDGKWYILLVLLSFPFSFSTQTANPFDRHTAPPATINNIRTFEMASHGTTTASNPLSAPPFGDQVVYTDGSFDNSAAGCAFVFKDRTTEMWYGFAASFGFEASSKTAELMGIKHALLYAKDNWIGRVTELEIRTDCRFAVGDIQHCWNHGVARGWNHHLVTIEICDLIDELRNAASPLMVSIQAIRGHSGIRGNDLADELAVTTRRTSIF
ncbi:Ribonuclease H [Pseudocercospora fuligena]|uniref:Ribonuclease H n=1 Tax=Pseudocercospora fuligena TaxID=685502 RepID=A0A8H6RIJ0_9PEZI|nr:Ribonuclease H [Pseudocercospora fuligena]